MSIFRVFEILRKRSNLMLKFQKNFIELVAVLFKAIPIILTLFFWITFCPKISSASPFSSSFFKGSEFKVTPELAPRVEFWKLIFAKYGRNHAVFHNRRHPHIIYSILDFNEFAPKSDSSLGLRGLSPEMKKRKKKALELETKRIENLLKKLIVKGPGNDADEKRIYDLYQKFKNPKAELKKAIEKKQIRSQTGIKERFREGVKRSGRYMYAIEKIFDEYDLPKELARLPLVESSFNYKAYSSVGAAGIWQFMRSTGRSYMKVNTAVDERRDAIISSRSAARYLKGAYKRLGKWPLAVTSYNHGVAGMARAVKRVGSSDIVDIINKYEWKTFGFASSNFYPELLAAIEIEQNYKKYFKGLELEKPWYFDEVKIPKNLNVTQLRKVFPGSLDDLKKYNTGILKSVYQGRRSVPSGFVLKTPKGKGRELAKNLKNSKLLNLSEGTKLAAAHKPSQRSARSSTKYLVRRGDTLSGIARKFGVSTKALKQVNGISKARNLRIGKTLKIPKGNSGSRSGRRAFHTVRKGQSLIGISKRYRTKLTALRNLNPGLKSRIYPGQKIRVK